MPEVARDNHYVPIALIDRWAGDDGQVQAYRILVSHETVPLWTPQSPKGIAYARDLYTGVSDGKERDDFEKWIEAEFESPGLAAAGRLVSGRRLSPDDWRAMIRLYAAQSVRTPASYLEFKEWCEANIQSAIEASVASALGVMRAAPDRSLKRIAEASHPGVASAKSNGFASLVRVKIDETADHEGRVAIRAEMTAGRTSWIAQMRYLLNGVIERLYDLRWHVWTPFGDEEWPLTDHPALRVNYDGPNRYSVRGGWGFK